MRKILEFPSINENDIGKVAKIIDFIAHNSDRDCSHELNVLQRVTGKSHTVEEFAEYWSWTDLDNLAKITLTPEPPYVNDLDRVELETIVGIIRESIISGKDDMGVYYEELIHKSMSIPDVIGYIMSDEDVKNIVDKMLSAKDNVILL